MEPEIYRSRAWAFTPETQHETIFLKFSGLLETLLTVGASIAFAIAAQRIITPNLGVTLGLATGSPPDFLASSLVLLKQFLAQYGGLFLVVFMFALIRDRTSMQSYALTKGEQTYAQLILFGLIGGAFAAIPSELILLAKTIYPLGQDTPVWTVISATQWDWKFWVFMAVGSFILIPCLEELAWRGYALGRLVECFGPGAALTLTTLTFALLHTQYLANADALGLLTLAAVIFSALVFGVMTLRTGSLVPAIIAHVMINTPKSFEFGILTLSLYSLAVFLARRPIGLMIIATLKEVVSKETAIALALSFALLGLGILAFSFKTPGLITFGVIALFIAIGSRWIKRSAWA